MNRNTTLGGIAALVIGAVVAWQNGTLDQFIGQQLNGNNSQAFTSDAPSGQRQSGNDNRASRSQDGDFDFYVLAMSWSPTFCEDDTRGSDQCSGRRPYGFVAHGLWPQNEKGWPENCNVSARVPDRTVNEMLQIMPAKGLIFHQWKKHGTCSGMQPAAYFDTVQDAWNKVKIPATFDGLSRTITVKPRVIEEAFMEVNPKLTDKMISINCNRKRLREVRVCFDKDLNFRQCSKEVQRECRDNAVRMPPVRG
jgi:ribonuclease T2